MHVILLNIFSAIQKVELDLKQFTIYTKFRCTKDTPLVDCLNLISRFSFFIKILKLKRFIWIGICLDGWHPYTTFREDSVQATPPALRDIQITTQKTYNQIVKKKLFPTTFSTARKNTAFLFVHKKLFQFHAP